MNTDIENPEETLVEEFEVRQDEVDELKTHVETVVRRVFDENNIEVGDESIELVQDRLILNCVYMMVESEWPPEDGSLLKANKPEEHFEYLLDEMRENGREAETSISITLGELSVNMGLEHPVSKYVLQKMSEKYGSG